MMTRGEFFMIKEMYERGMSISDMARKWRIDRKTVRKYIQPP
ncbi:IS21 family transposase, partial [Anoxybacillus rupiensis]|nr:IS21 family transposase [Anoxybacillus rupiensis]